MDTKKFFSYGTPYVNYYGYTQGKTAYVVVVHTTGHCYMFVKDNKCNKTPIHDEVIKHFNLNIN
jgi:hypothetical protein